MTVNTVDCAGDPRHPNHAAWLAELGRATFAAARVSGICFDLARIFGTSTSAEMYQDPLGGLINRVKSLGKTGAPAGLDEFLTRLTAARVDRNDLFHALPVKDGLHRRRTDNPSYVRNFYEVADIAVVTASLSAAADNGGRLLYADGGRAVQAWYDRGGS